MSDELLRFFPSLSCFPVKARRVPYSEGVKAGGRNRVSDSLTCPCSSYPKMSYNSSFISARPEEDPKGGSFLEESSGEGDDSSVLGGDSSITGPLGAVLLVMCLTGMVGNIYTVAVAFGRVAGHSVGSLGVYVINLALADLLYLSTIPFVVCTYFAHDWFFGDVGCRLLLSLDLLTMHASIFLLTAMSLERYWAVARPLQARQASNAYRKLVSTVLWLLSLLLTSPMMVMTQLREGDGPHKRICIPTWTPAAFRLYLTVLFTTSILAPGMVLGIVYTRLAWAYWSSAWGPGLPLAGRASARQLFSRISAIVVAYWACFLPFWAWQLTRLYRGERLGIGPTTQAYLNFSVTCLAYGNSCINPFLYTLLASSYRRSPGRSGMGTARPPVPSWKAAGGPVGRHSIPPAFGELLGSVGESKG
ncbi:urotensin-2 receptor-like [Falco biarmicus]|uniref:urotensin-2 receptor-like n=1 Tax=Falco rusticolus TaxID=120794 RepID=UPI000FFC7D54|nr:urotensin-2 receptor-like [Falco rusticolus]XP_056198043.1 urotensin-2 receptor-like [Falco biarmicus]